MCQMLGKYFWDWILFWVAWKARGVGFWGGGSLLVLLRISWVGVCWSLRLVVSIKYFQGLFRFFIGFLFIIGNIWNRRLGSLLITSFWGCWILGILNMIINIQSLNFLIKLVKIRNMSLKFLQIMIVTLAKRIFT